MRKSEKIMLCQNLLFYRTCTYSVAYWLIVKCNLSFERNDRD